MKDYGKISEKGQVCIPKHIREKLGLKKETFVIFEMQGKKILMQLAKVEIQKFESKKVE